MAVTGGSIPVPHSLLLNLVPVFECLQQTSIQLSGGESTIKCLYFPIALVLPVDAKAIHRFEPYVTALIRFHYELATVGDDPDCLDSFGTSSTSEHSSAPLIPWAVQMALVTATAPGGQGRLHFPYLSHAMVNHAFFNGSLMLPFGTYTLYAPSPASKFSLLCAFMHDSNFQVGLDREYVEVGARSEHIHLSRPGASLFFS